LAFKDTENALNKLQKAKPHPTFKTRSTML
jgi:hypothetical protein